MIYPIFFSSKNDNNYIFDNSTRMVLPANKYGIKDTDVKDAILINDKIIQRIREDHPRIPLFQDVDMESQQRQLIDNCKKHVMENGIRQLTLMITEQCNFRCKYCIYSEMYSYSRSHSYRTMEWEVAKKAIDYYMSVNKKSVQYNPTLMPCIGFYGGEALTNWGLIVRAVEYVESVYRREFNNLIYTITTNGSLLDLKKISFLLEYNFFINISIDGYKENHNRNRVYVSGKDTYDDIMNNVAVLESEFNKAKNKDKTILPYQFVMTYDNEVSIKRLVKEAEIQPELYAHFSRMSKVRGIDTNYYIGQCSEKLLNMEINKLVDQYAEGKVKNPIAEILYKQNVVIPAFNIQFSNNILWGTCIPGEKLAVSCEGKFYICEKIDYQSSIGNVDAGIDFCAVKKYLEEFVDMRNKNCKTCYISNLCNQCYSQCSNGDGQFKLNDVMCSKMKKNIAKIFSIYYTARENGIDLL